MRAINCVRNDALMSNDHILRIKVSPLSFARHQFSPELLSNNNILNMKFLVPIYFLGVIIAMASAAGAFEGMYVSFIKDKKPSNVYSPVFFTMFR